MSLGKIIKGKTNICTYTTSIAPPEDPDSSTDCWYYGKIRNGFSDTILYDIMKKKMNTDSSI